MNDIELEKFMAGIDFTNELEYQLFVMTMAEHDAEIEAEEAKKWQKPEWINIGRGLIEAPDDVKAQAVKIYGEFCRFHPAKQVDTFKELVELFTLAKITNKINTEKERL